MSSWLSLVQYYSVEDDVPQGLSITNTLLLCNIEQYGVQFHRNADLLIRPHHIDRLVLLGFNEPND